MRLVVSLLLLFFAASVQAQIKECGIKEIKFVSTSNRVDSLGDLKFRKNWFELYYGFHNTIKLNKKLSTIKNFSVEGAEICSNLNDSILAIIPVSKIVKFNYKYKGKSISILDTVKNFPIRRQTNLLLDNKIQQVDKPLVNYRIIDTISFEFERTSMERYFPKQDFEIDIYILKIFLVRGRKVMKSQEFKGGNAFSISGFFKDALPGDVFSIEFQPQFASKYQNDYYRFNCSGRLITYTLGSSK